MKDGTQKNPPCGTRGRKGSPVRCKQTGIIYPNAVNASLSLGMARGAVSLAIAKYRAGKWYQPRAGGFTWEYATEEKTK